MSACIRAREAFRKKCPPSNSSTANSPVVCVRHACTAYLTFVHLGPDLRPRPCPPFTPETPGERRRWEAAMVRREARLQRVKRLRAAIQTEKG